MDGVLEGVRLAGLAASVPAAVELVAESGYGTPETRARFVRSTGIEARRRAPPEQFASDLAHAAAERLLEGLGWARDSLDALIFVTQTPDFISPATACTLQDRLGLDTACAAFDVNLGCSAYPYGVHIAGSFLKSGSRGRVLLLVADTPGKRNLPSGKDDYAPLFGDAGSATALERADGAPPIRCRMHTDGSGWNAILDRHPKGRPGFPAEGFAFEPGADGSMKVGSTIDLDGEAVFNFSVRTVPRAVRELLDAAGWDIDSVDAFVFHQANKMINAFIAKKLGLGPDRAPSTLGHFANTSTTTIPLTLVDRCREALTSGPQRLVLCGFGVGLSWATMAVETDRIVCPPIAEL